MQGDQPTNILILGAREGSLGDAIRTELELRHNGHHVTTAGISGDEDRPLTSNVIVQGKWDHIICTIGKNPGKYEDIFQTNVVLPMRYLELWLVSRVGPSGPGSYVIISSNSARVPRSGSGPYCASKAALSMAVECEARYIAGHRRHFGSTYLYGYEPCWIEGTPMSQSIQNQLEREKGNPAQLHRVPGGVALEKRDLASLIVSNLPHGKILHGRNLRVDLGDQ